MAFCLPALRETGREQTERQSKHRTRFMCFCPMMAAFCPSLGSQRGRCLREGILAPLWTRDLLCSPWLPHGSPNIYSAKRNRLESVPHPRPATSLLLGILLILCVFIILEKPPGGKSPARSTGTFPSRASRGQPGTPSALACPWATALAKPRAAQGAICWFPELGQGSC